MAELDERIRQAEVKLKQLRAQKQQAEARKRALESKKLRAEETRRKILVGAAILGKVERGEWPRDRLLKRSPSDVKILTPSRPPGERIFKPK